MTEAEKKAKELVNQFYQPLGHLNIYESAGNMWEHAKQCAIIAVDEILDLHEDIPTMPQVSKDY